VKPELSVVIPVRDAADTIEAQLDALLGQDWDRPWEIVIVDNGSRDATATIVERYRSQDARVRLVDASDRPGVAHCRNVGIREACADAIAMCDADDVVRPGWVRTMGESLRTHELVTGPLDITTLNPDWVLETRGRAIADGPGQFFGIFEFAHSCNLGFRRDVVQRCGGFDEALAAGEDVELSGRLWRAGVKLVYLDDAVVSYRYRTSRRGLWRQARSFGQVRPELFRRVERDGIHIPAEDRRGRLRSWAYLARNVGLLASRSGRAKWVWVAAGNVGRLEGDLRAPWAGRVR
jgi:glycosyltransferase involved in cell wall biosynthesis